MRVYMYTKYPNLGGSARIIKILKKNNIKLEYSYDIRDFEKKKYDVLIIPGGTAAKQQKDLGSQGIDIILNFVSNGGKYIGICAGAYLASVPYNINKPGIGLINIKYLLPSKKMNLKGHVFVETSTGVLKIIYHNGPFFEEPIDNDIKILGRIIGTEGFNLNLMLNKPCILMSKYKKGTVIVCGPHPESTKGLSKMILEFIYL